MIRIVGVDPDTNATGVALVQEWAGRLSFKLFSVRAKGATFFDRAREMAARIRHLSASFDQLDLVVIEWPHVRPHSRGPKTGPRPNDIVNLAGVSGMALSAFSFASKVMLPLPAAWKGSIKAEVHEKLILKEAGLTLASPEFCDILPSLRKHTISALGIALWGMKQHRKACQIKELLKNDN